MIRPIAVIDIICVLSFRTTGENNDNLELHL